MGIIDRLLMWEVLKTLALMLVVLGLLLLSNTMVRYLGLAANGMLGTDVLLVLVGLELVTALGQIVPPAFFFSVLWVLGRMYRDSEMIALEASGFGHARIFRSVLLVAFPLALLVVVLMMEVLPWARGHVAQVKAEQANSADISGVRSGRFNEFSRGGLVVYTDKLSKDGSKLQGVFIQDRQQGQLGLVTAEDAYQTVDPETGDRFVVLGNGQRYEGTPGKLDFKIGRFQEYAVRVPSLVSDGSSAPRSASSWQTLLESENPRDWAQFQFRLSVPVALLAFAVLAVPLARSPPRSGVYGRLIFAVLLYFTFINLQRFAQEWLEDGLVPSWVGMWWLPVLMLAVTGLIVLLDSNWFWVNRRRLVARRT